MSQLQKLKFFIYARKSSEGEERQMLSIDGQLGELQKTVEKESLNVVASFIESGSAHKPNNRPQFFEMIKRINKGEANAILCWHINRLSRNPLDSATIQWNLQQGKIQAILTPYRLYQTEDNALIFSIETSEANQYSRDLSMNVKRGLQQKIDMGWPPGSAPLGYLNTKSSVRGSNTVIPDPERWHIIRKAFDLLLSHAYTAPQIVNILSNDYGLRTRPGKINGNKPISRSTIYRIFTDPFYYGYFLRKENLYKGAYKPMITVDEFDTVQLILGREGKPRPKTHFFPFTGLIKCGVCGSSITASEKTKIIKTTGEIKTYVFYHCTRRKKGGDNCSERKYIPSQKIEEAIVKELADYEIIPIFKEWAIQILHQNHDVEIMKRQKLVSDILKVERKLQNELNNLIDLCISGELSDSIYQQKKVDRENRLIRVEAKKKVLQDLAKNYINEVERRLGFASNIVSRFNKADVSTKKEICHQFGWNWVLKDEKLLINKASWLQAIKKYGSYVRNNISRLELKNYLENKGQNVPSKLNCPVVRGLVDEVGTSSP